MSRNRHDPHAARLRRERIRREAQALRGGASPSPDPIIEHPFASERALRQMEAMLEGHKFTSIDDVNAHLAKLTAGGRLSEMADAWKRDDPKWRAQELAYDALETDSFEEALRLVHDALKLDPDCTDALRLMASLAPMPLDNRILLMRDVVERAERNMGERFIEERTGSFWSTVSTRPYMRAKQHLGELLAEAGNLEGATAVFEQMLDLNPTDNQGMRYLLLGLYLATGQPEKASGLMSRSPGEEKFLGSFAWARVLERWLSGDPDGAKAALARARKVNPFAEAYIAGTRELPRHTPEYFRPGDESEAQTCAKELEAAWRSHPGFREWLRAQR